MSFFDDEYFEEEDDFIEDEGDTMEELEVDENGHVIEKGRKRRYSRDDEYEPDFEDSYPEDDFESEEDN
jgi:hypothetical protein